MNIRTSPGIIALGICAAILAAGPAPGHAKLVGTSPAGGAQLTASPTSLTLTFNEKVRLAVLKLRTGGHAVAVRLDGDAPPTVVVTVALPVLSAGTYDVEWSALTPSDGHVVKGAYSFVIR